MKSLKSKTTKKARDLCVCFCVFPHFQFKKFWDLQRIKFSLYCQWKLSVVMLVDNLEKGCWRVGIVDSIIWDAWHLLFLFWLFFSSANLPYGVLVFVICMCVYPCVVQCACEFSQRSRKGTRSPDPGVTRGCESLGMGSGNKTRSSAILSSALNFQVISPGPSPSLWHKFCDLL